MWWEVYLDGGRLLAFCVGDGGPLCAVGIGREELGMYVDDEAGALAAIDGEGAKEGGRPEAPLVRGDGGEGGVRRFTRDVDRCGRCPNFTMDPERMGEATGRPRCLAVMPGGRSRATSPVGEIPGWCPLPEAEEGK
jgi:hypothetical protein